VADKRPPDRTVWYVLLTMKPYPCIFLRLAHGPQGNNVDKTERRVKLGMETIIDLVEGRAAAQRSQKKWSAKLPQRKTHGRIIRPN